MSKATRHGALGLLILLSISACGGPELVDSVGREEALAAFRQLHTRVYDVYDLGDPERGPDREAIHSLLSSSFAGDALTDEYVEHFTTLARMGREHTAIDVLDVDYESLDLAGGSESQIEVIADWSVGGIVRHQLHSHHRVNRYQASYTLARAAEGAEGLRIVSSRVRNAERIRNPLAGAGTFPLDDLPTSSRGMVGPAELIRAGILDEAPGEPEPGPQAPSRP